MIESEHKDHYEKVSVIGEKVLISTEIFHTKKKNWSCMSLHHNRGSIAKVTNIHPTVDEAIQLRFENGRKAYAHFLDLFPLDVEEYIKKKTVKFKFNPTELVT